MGAVEVEASTICLSFESRSLTLSPGTGQSQWVYCILNYSFHARQVRSNAENNFKPSTSASLEVPESQSLSI